MGQAGAWGAHFKIPLKILSADQLVAGFCHYNPPVCNGCPHRKIDLKERVEGSKTMLGVHMVGLHLGLNVPYVKPHRTPGGLLMSGPSKIWTPDDIAWSPTSFASGHNERDEILGPLSGKYCADLRQVVRRKTRTVTAGPVSFGSEHPIVRQTMGTLSTVKHPSSAVPDFGSCASSGRA